MKLYYKEYGSNTDPLLVFLHGGGVSGWMWDKQVSYFSSRYHCLVPDLPEQGKSEKTALFTIQDSAKQVLTLINEKRNGRPVIVVGFSLGAQVLISMLSIKQNNIDHAIINSALVRPIPFAKIMLRSMMFTFPLVKLKSFAKLQAKSMYIHQDLFDVYFQESKRVKKETFIRIMEENMAFTIPATFSEAQANILVTVGEKERSIMKKSLQDLIKSHPSITGLVIPNIGHGVSLANPMLFNEIVKSWIEQQALPQHVIQIES
ncbi:alpha/beta hydrolase [Alkalihalobacillus sp. LMS39]|uniref:alpha/beta fold hydrolase n=1 Tax=Alkalihalobacillus sp. LMS39 TaxID=2924032 RepID=UPI001FB33522|nr:alpha/beta hydrolase [Alkalihalobacillus sp. LMS39]UOE96308.1 alpha/beta hydrolase [Alkalihalobacillus sp. LMS39]